MRKSVIFKDFLGRPAPGVVQPHLRAMDCSDIMELAGMYGEARYLGDVNLMEAVSDRIGSVIKDQGFGQLQTILDGQSAETISETSNAYAEENSKLRAFAQDVIGEWPDSPTLDGGDIQELATKHGLFVEELRSEPCGDGCMCAEVVSPEEFAAGSVLCYRKTALLLGHEVTETFHQPTETNDQRKG